MECPVCGNDVWADAPHICPEGFVAPARRVLTFYGYNATTGSFSVMDPNYPGNSLTLGWSASTGFSASSYSRAQGYSPALANFAFSGQAAIHRQSDYATLYAGSLAGYPASEYASISVTSISNVVGTLDLSQTVTLSTDAGITVSGTVTNGDTATSSLFWSQNGQSPRTLVAVDPSTGAFSFTIPNLNNDYLTTVVLETSANPCDPTFSHTGYLQFSLAVENLAPYFVNACFENGGGTNNTNPWVLSHGSNSAHYYPGGTGSSYNTATPVWGTTSAYSLNFESSSHAASPITWTVDNSGTATSLPMTPATIQAITASGFPTTGASADGTGPWTALVNSSAHALDNEVGAENYISLDGVSTAVSPAGVGISMVLDGQYALMVNSAITSSHICMAQQTFTVPASSVVASPKLSFYWAGATQSGGHTPDELPFIDIVVQDATNSYAVLYYVHHFAPSVVGSTVYTDGYPGWISATGGTSATAWWGINWQKVGVDLTGLGTHEIVVTVVAAGCTQGGHAGYAYLDSMTCD